MPAELMAYAIPKAHRRLEPNRVFQAITLEAELE
jgi:hypothetical protein